MHAVGQANLHPAKLTPLPRMQAPELTREQMLEQVLWQDDALDSSYEKVTF